MLRPPMARRKQARQEITFAAARFDIAEYEVEFHVVQRTAGVGWRTLCGVEQRLGLPIELRDRARTITTSCEACSSAARAQGIPRTVMRFPAPRLPTIPIITDHADPERGREMAVTLFEKRLRIFLDPGIVDRALESLRDSILANRFETGRKHPKP